MNAPDNTLTALCERHGVADLYAFGSRGPEIAARLRGADAACAHPGSDLDIGVRFLADALAARGPGAAAWPPGAPPEERRALDRLDALIALAGDLEDMLQSGRVDLVDVTRADPFVAADIVRGELLYRSDPADQAEFELYILRRAGDLAWFKRREMRAVIHGEPL